jgi:protein gp37
LLEDLGKINLEGIHWVIVGGESGAQARPLKEEWVNSILEQCTNSNVPFFFKQWGGVHKKRAGRELRGRTFDQLPDILRTEFPDRLRRMEILASLTQEFSNLL